MKKKFKHLVVVAATLSCFSAGAQSWSWAKDIPATSFVETKGIATDNYRNNYLVSNFVGTGTFGSTTLVSTGGSYDVALSKMDESGNYVWTASVIAGTGFDQGTAVICDPLGSDIYVTGQFYGTATFGGTTVLTSAGNADIFIAKFNSSGALVWAVQAGGTSFDECYDIAWAKCNGCKGSSVYITGMFTGTGTFGTNTIISPVSSSMFTAAYSGNTGANNWVRQASSTTNSVYSRAITADAANNVYVTGMFYSTATFGGFVLAATSNDQFAMKYNSSGTEQWVKQGGGTSTDQGCDLRADASGNLYVAGEYASGTSTYGLLSVTGMGGSDIVVVKYNSSGTEQWATKAGGTWNDNVTGLALDITDNLWITGYFSSSIANFGAIALTQDASQDPFVARLTNAGVFNKAVSPSGTPSYAVGYPDDITVSSIGHVFIAGSFQYGLVFGPTTISTGGAQHGFAAKLKPADWPVVEGTYDMINNSDVDAAGNVYICGENAFNYSAFIKKINASGSPQWINYGSPGLNSDVKAKAVTCDASGNVYGAGQYFGTATFGATALAAGTANQAGFLVKYNSSGVLQWAIRAANALNGHVYINDITTDASGNVYMTGEYAGNVTFGTGAGAITLFNLSVTYGDVFIAKFDNAGNILMASTACYGSGQDEGLGIALVGSDIFLSGTFNSGATFSTITVFAIGGNDMFVAKYNSSGVCQAVMAGGATGADYMFDLVAAGGNIYAVGAYSGPGTGSFGGTSITSSGSWDGLLVKINPASMTMTWMREVKNTSDALGKRVDASATGVYITGYFNGSGTFGDGTTVVGLTSAGNNDVFVEKFDNAGTYQWVKQIGGANSDIATGLGIDALGHAYAAGNFVTSTVIDGTNYYGSYFIEKCAFDDGTFARLAAEETEAPPAENVTVYPNPFSDYTVFDIPADYEGNYTLALYDVSGREAIRQSGTLGGQLLLRKEGLAPGLYTYILFFDRETPATGKLVVE